MSVNTAMLIVCIIVIEQFSAQTNVFLDEAVLDGASARFAITSMKYILPAVVLEDIEHDTVWLQCSETSLSIKFSDVQSLVTAKESWSNFSKFLIITSHRECNEDGERAIYE